ncbi:pilus assembly protein N-terminal domain-containing protein [bacterium]|nr:pilus assembly protein N-terminal domain-containing protein [bacterium]
MKTIFFLFFIFSVALFAQAGDTIDMGVGQQKVVNVKGLQRVAIGDPGVIDVQAVGADQIIITAKKHGRTTLILWLNNGKRIGYTVRVSMLDPQGVVKDVASLLKDIEGIKIKVADQYIILDGEVYRGMDYIRIQQVMAIFPIVKSLVIISPEAKIGIVKQLNDMFKENSLKDVRASVIGDMIFLEGFVSDEREKIKTLSIAKSLGLKQSSAYQMSQSQTQQQNGEGASGVTQTASVVEDGTNIGQEFIDLVGIGLKKMILLEVEFVEIRKSNHLKLGFNWASKSGEANTLEGVFTSFFDVTKPDGTTIPVESSSILYPNNVNNYNFASFFNISTNLSLLSDDGYSRILAQPKLLCASGGEAKFLSGGEIPIPVSQDGAVSVEWKEYGVKLDMNPVADADGNILTSVKTEVSEPDWANQVQGIPAFVNRKVETIITVHTGDTIVLSGLYRNDNQKGVTKLAGFGHIPILGELFKSRDFQEGKSDLLIFVTPRIVRPDAGTIKDMMNKMKRRYELSHSEVGFSIFD